MSEETALQRKLRERREAQERARPPEPEKFDSDLIPEDERNLSEADKALDQALSRVDIIAAYAKYCGKMRPTVRNGQRESIMISCPIPGHADKVPSAWINLDKKTWYCAKCGRGGDAQDLAALAKGLSWPETYKTDGSFHKLQEDMAADFGFVSVKLPGGAVMIAEPEVETQPTEPKADSSLKTDSPNLSVVPDNTVTDDTVIELFDDEADSYPIPALDWDEIIEPGTFLSEYMRATVVDDAPEEFHLFHGLVALGFALGRDVTLFDTVSVYANLFICTLGRSGSGKSKAKAHLDRLLEQALPYKHDDANSKGTKRVNTPGSAEVLIHSFQKPVMDPVNPKVLLYNAPVRGLIEYSELSSLIGRTNRQGTSTLKPTMMQFYDMERTVSTSSMTTGLKEAAEPFACAVTSTQPKALKTLLSQSDDSSGFLNRWAFVLGTPKKKFAIGGTTVDITPAVAPLSEIFAWAGTFLSKEQITWSEEAQELFETFFHTRIEPDKNNFQSDLIVRIDLLMKKLVLLFTANLKLKEVPVKAVNQAMACYEYLVAGYALPANEIGNTLATEIRNAVIEYAKKQYKLNGKGISLSALNRTYWRRNYPLKLLADTVDQLVKFGMLSMETSNPGTKGRPVVKYKYVD